MYLVQVEQDQNLMFVKIYLKFFKRLKKRIIVTSFASNVARMESVFYCAEKTGRHISLVGRSMHRIFKAARQCGYLKNVIDPIDPEMQKIYLEKKLFIYVLEVKENQWVL